MKNTFLKLGIFSLMIAGVWMAFASCSKDEISQKGNKALLTAGKWQLISAVRTVSGGTGMTIEDAPPMISFTSANHYRIYDEGGSVIHDVDYTFDDKNTITFDGDTYDLTAINSSNMTMVHTSDDDITVDTYNYKRKL